MKRLYVGGLGHTVTQKDMRDRFGKFGDVQDVELRTRRDDDGVPLKTFGYVNIVMSDADLKKCMTVLNRSKWKGGTLQIEAAKESFLQRLAREREDQDKPEPVDPPPTQQLMESLKTAGVENFHMKSAVPGTPVPGHKDWVVSKFGRVLPVLQLKSKLGGKTRTIRCDPSKHSHNLRKLEPNQSSQSSQYTPVCQLTWALPGGDDDISRKRRGEFPPTEPWRPKRSRAEQEAVATDTGAVEAQHSSQGTPGQNVEEDTLEVVGPDYHLTLTFDRLRQRAGQVGEEEEYDSADTDELVTSRQAGGANGSHSHNPRQGECRTSVSCRMQENGNAKKRMINTGQRRRTPSGPSSQPNINQNDEDGGSDTHTGQTSSSQSDSDDEDKGLKTQRKNIPEPSSQPVVNHEDVDDVEESESRKTLPEPSPQSVVNHSEEEEEEDDTDADEDCSYTGQPSSSQSDGDNGGGDEGSDYEILVSSCPRVELSLMALQQLVNGSQEAPEAMTPGAPWSSDTGIGVGALHKKCITPEEILASIFEEDSSEDERKSKKKKKKKAPPLPAFQRSAHLMEKQEEVNGQEVKSRKLKKRKSSSSTSSSDEEKLDTPSANSSSRNLPKKEESSSSSNEDCCQEDPGVGAAPPPSFRVVDEEQQQRDNRRRLAALEQRQKQAQQQRSLIQGALANLDTPAGTGRRIVFASDDDADDDFQDGQPDPELSTDKATPTGQSAAGKEKNKTAGSQLFDSEGEDDEEDGSRFQIKPQFEGMAGQRLMRMQAGFGTDERFKMDARFLENEEEEDKEQQDTKMGEVEEEDDDDDDNNNKVLQEEKKRNISILENVLNKSLQTRTPANRRQTFRDISALQYDPTKEEHAMFETQDNTEMKLSKKKKRQKVTEKVPEVSKETFYNVSSELCSLFGASREEMPGEGVERGVSWDKQEEEEEEEPQQQKGGGGGGGDEQDLLSSLLSDSGKRQEEAQCFKFSFFGDETEQEAGKQSAEYHVETLLGPKVSWQPDRFHDSSSEDEEDEETSPTSKPLEQQTPSKQESFFFSAEDPRLKEGPGWFCRSSTLEEQKDGWNERRVTLRQECRKKHREARKNWKPSLKS